MTDESTQPEPAPDEYAIRPSPALPPGPERQPRPTLEELREQALGRPQFSLRQAMLLTAATALFLGLTIRLLPDPATYAGALGLLCLLALLIRPFLRTRWVLVDLTLWILLGMYGLACLRGLIEHRPPIE
jgi:hypothetical protein